MFLILSRLINWSVSSVILVGVFQVWRNYRCNILGAFSNLILKFALSCSSYKMLTMSPGQCKVLLWVVIFIIHFCSTPTLQRHLTFFSQCMILKSYVSLPVYIWRENNLVHGSRFVCAVYLVYTTIIVLFLCVVCSQRTSYVSMCCKIMTSLKPNWIVSTFAWLRLRFFFQLLCHECKLVTSQIKKTATDGHSYWYFFVYIKIDTSNIHKHYHDV